jgi:hypothetical protein
MAVSLISCYFLPFLLFFVAQLAFPKSPASFAFGLAGLSIGTLILYFILKDQKQVVHVPVPVQAKESLPVPEPVVQTKPPIKKLDQSPIANYAKNALKRPIPYKAQSTGALIEEQKLALVQQRDYFLHEGEKNAQAIKELQEALNTASQALSTKDAEFQAQAAEMANLKFEMYTLLRIDSYMAEKEPSKNLLTASL